MQGQRAPKSPPGLPGGREARAGACHEARRQPAAGGQAVRRSSQAQAAARQRHHRAGAQDGVQRDALVRGRVRQRIARAAAARARRRARWRGRQPRGGRVRAQRGQRDWAVASGCGQRRGRGCRGKARCSERAHERRLRRRRQLRAGPATMRRWVRDVSLHG